MRIAVAGGTGVVGRQAVEAAIRGGHDAVAISRGTGVDLTTGKGLAAVLEGADVVVDTTNVATRDRAAATAFFTAVARHLQAVGAEQGVSRVVTLSIVGIDRVPGFGYYQAKLAHEAAAREGQLPSTVVRASQFHEFAAQILAGTRRGPLAVVPIMRIQPVAARALGELLVEIAAAPADDAGPIEVAGPGQLSLAAAARAVVRRRGRRVVVVPVPMPGATGRAMRSGALLPGDGVRIVGPTFEQWLGTEDAAYPPF